MATTKPDGVCLAAEDRARSAAVEVAGSAEQVGDHLGYEADGERLLTHLFDARVPGYRGWRWAVTVTRVPRARTVTINDVVMVAGPQALVAPQWVPWSERLEPGDLTPGLLRPTSEDDPRLVPSYASLTKAASELDETQDFVSDLVGDLLLTRSRVLSVAGADEAADRWQASEAGPDTPVAVAAPKRCHTCGFLVPLTGLLGSSFGVCANGLVPDDGRVVALGHGCGGHSEVSVPVDRAVEPPVLVYSSEVDLLF